MDTFTGAKPEESELGAGRTAPAGLVGAGIALIAVVGLIHMIDAPEDLEEGSYLGFLFVANFLGALVAAAGIYRENRWGWVIGLLLAGGVFAGYVISRTAGLPGLPAEEEWLEPLGVHFLVVEALFAGIFLAVCLPPRRRAGKPALRHQKFSKEEGHDQEGIDAARDGRLDGGRGDRRCRGVYAGRDPDRNPHQGPPRACGRLRRSQYRIPFPAPDGRNGDRRPRQGSEARQEVRIVVLR